MTKESIRPLLVEALEKACKAEAAIEREVERNKVDGWQSAAVLQESWKAARLKRAKLELQLWLADRQWEREERELAEKEAELASLEETAQKLGIASPTGKV